MPRYRGPSSLPETHTAPTLVSTPPLQPRPLRVVDSAVDVHVIGLSGFPASSQLPQPQDASGKKGSGSRPDERAPSLVVDKVEKLTGYVKFAVVTVAFDQPVYISRQQASPSGFAAVPSNSAASPTTPPAGPSSGDMFFSAQNTTYERFGALGLTRLVCGTRLFDSHPSMTQDNSPPRFLVPTDYLSLFVSEVPAVAVAAPWLHSCGGRGGFPSPHQLSFTLLMAHSRAGEAGTVLLSDEDLASCRLNILPRSSQSWRPAGAITNANGDAFVGSVPLGASVTGAGAAHASGGAQGARPAPSPRELALRRNALCWGSSNKLYRPMRGAPEAIFASAGKSKQAFIEELISLQPSRSASASGGGGKASGSRHLGMNGARDMVAAAAKSGPSFLRESTRKHGQGMVGMPVRDRTVYDVLEAGGIAMLEQGEVIDPTSSAASGSSSSPSPSSSASAAAAARQWGPSLSQSAVNQLVGSLVLHAEPWALSMLEVGTASALHARTGTGNIMTNIIGAVMKPIVQPMIDLVGGVVAEDIFGALAEGITDHTTHAVTQQVVDGLEPLLTGEIITQVVPAITEITTDFVIDRVSRTVAQLVLEDVIEPITEEVGKRLGYSLTPKVVSDIVGIVASGAATNLTRPLSLILPRALAHSIVPALSMTLTISPYDHNYCFKCLIETDEDSCKRCPPSMRTKSIWGMPPHLYYALYYTGYYSTYYSSYYSDIFSASQGLKVVRRKHIEINDVNEDLFYFQPVFQSFN